MRYSGRGRDDVEGDVLGEGDEVVVAGDEVGLAVDLDEGADLGVRVDVRLDRSLGGGPLAAILDPLALLDAEDLDRLVDVSVGLGQGLLAIHHSGAGPVAEGLDLGSLDLAHLAATSSGVTVPALASAAAGGASGASVAGVSGAAVSAEAVGGAASAGESVGGVLSAAGESVGGVLSTAGESVGVLSAATGSVGGALSAAGGGVLSSAGGGVLSSAGAFVAVGGVASATGSGVASSAGAAAACSAAAFAAAAAAAPRAAAPAWTAATAASCWAALAASCRSGRLLGGLGLGDRFAGGLLLGLALGERLGLATGALLGLAAGALLGLLADSLLLGAVGARPLGDDVADRPGDRRARADRVVVAGNHVLDPVGVAVGVDEADDRDPQALGLGDGDRLGLEVDDEDRRRNAFHVLHAAEVGPQLGEVGLGGETLARGQQRELALGVVALEVVESLDPLADRLEVGQQAAEPAVVDVRHSGDSRRLP